MLVVLIVELLCPGLKKNVPFIEVKTLIKLGNVIYLILTLGLGSFIGTIGFLIMSLEDNFEILGRGKG